ncbi:MAG TPA: tRNA-dihydrouridine synthase family protein [Desulfobacterales bacterium]|nr:tRNA-dihydrouridine synthase family protein [Desulfobacterales bacterium]
MAADHPNPRLILAPLKGFTDAIFRNTFAEHFDGFDGAMAPFVTTVAADRLTDKHVQDLLPQHNTRMPIEPQILGNCADDFIFLARRLWDMGYTQVNWNLGCPFRPVTKKRRGSGLLPFPEPVDEFLDRVLRALPGRLSIKMRLGHRKADEIFKLLPVFNRYPLKEITIHPRTARQMYGGAPDLDAFQACLAASRHPVVYNGDITDLAGFKDLEARFRSVRTWMIGRGALSNPFLPALIKNGCNGGAGRLHKFKDFYEDLFARYQERLSGPGHLLDRMKGFWTYFAEMFGSGPSLAKRIHRTFALPRYLDAVERFFKEEPVRPEN